MIVHLIKDNRDASWDTWDCYDETDKFLGSVPTLKSAGSVCKRPLHRGMHADKDKVSRSVADYNGIKGVSIYWAERN